MAIPNMQLGYVESDPMAVPRAASMSTGQESTFDRLLRDSVANDESGLEREPQPREQQPVDSEIAAAPDEPKAPRELDDPEAAEQPTDLEQDDLDSASTEPEADVTDSIRRGEPDQQAKTAGKGTDSPRTSRSMSEPLIAATLQGQNAQNQTATPTALANAQASNTVRTVEPTMRGSVNAALSSNSTPKAANVQTGYSTKSAAQAQMVEQARDSVFKQILMKLNNDGGEVRMRLDPPELGQLDLRMTVEGGNKLSLTIAAERQDVNQLLLRHLDELKQALQANGLEITGAEVQTRSEFADQQADRDANSGFAAGSNDPADDTESAPQPRGYVTAEGLDFWA